MMRPRRGRANRRSNRHSAAAPRGNAPARQARQRPRKRGRLNRGVPPKFFEVRRQRRVRVVHDRAGQIADDAVADPAFVQIGSAADAVRFEPNRRRPEQPDELFVGPAGGPDAAPAKRRDPAHAVRIDVGPRGGNGRTQRLVERFIRIQHERPGGRNALQRIAARGDEAGPGAPFDRRAGGLRNGNGGIARVRVEHEEPRAGRRRGQSVRNTRGLVLGQNDDGDIAGVQRCTSALASKLRERACSSVAPMKSR